jgi:hypothetical protein
MMADVFSGGPGIAGVNLTRYVVGLIKQRGMLSESRADVDVERGRSP